LLGVVTSSFAHHWHHEMQRRRGAVFCVFLVALALLALVEAETASCGSDDECTVEGTQATAERGVSDRQQEEEAENQEREDEDSKNQRDEEEKARREAEAQLDAIMMRDTRSEGLHIPRLNIAAMLHHESQLMALEYLYSFSWGEEDTFTRWFHPLQIGTHNDGVSRISVSRLEVREDNSTAEVELTEAEPVIHESSGVADTFEVVVQERIVRIVVNLPSDHPHRFIHYAVRYYLVNPMWVTMDDGQHEWFNKVRCNPPFPSPLA
jgi:hypothetical protein